MIIYAHDYLILRANDSYDLPIDNFGSGNVISKESASENMKQSTAITPLHHSLRYSNPDLPAMTTFSESTANKAISKMDLLTVPASPVEELVAPFKSTRINSVVEIR